MKLPISERLLCAASLVPEGTRAADVGCDHGFLGIHLLLTGKCPFVLASDFREKPLATAQKNAEIFGVRDRMRFLLSDGLDRIEPGAADTVCLCGMGGDLIRTILSRADWLQKKKVTLILQPQSGAADLRDDLAHMGFTIEREVPVRDHGFLYTVLRARFTGVCVNLSEGERWISRALICETSPLVREYWLRMTESVQKTVCSLENAKCEPDKLEKFRRTLAELLEMEAKLP